MTSTSKKCCVQNCSSTGQTQHRFPNPRFDLERMKLWLNAIGSEELNSQTPDVIYRNKRVCFAHFEARHKSSGNPRLHRNAVPTIGLQGFQEGSGNQLKEREPVFVEQPIVSPSNNDSLLEILGNGSPPATPKVFQAFVSKEPLPSSKEISTRVTVCAEGVKLSTPLVAVCENRVTDAQQASEEQQDNPDSDNGDAETVEELTTEHVSEIIALVRKVSNYVREVDPNVARSLTFRRTINNAMSCYRKIYVTKQVKKK